MLIDSLVPVYQFHERHQLRLAAASGALIDAALRPETSTDPWVRLFIRLREWPGRTLGLGRGLNQRAPFGLDDFTLLGRDGEREAVLGLAGRFWRFDYGLIPFSDAEQFQRLNTPGIARLAMNFTVDPQPDGSILLATETRIYCTSRAAYWRFLPYWLLIRPVSGLIRRRLLTRIRDAGRVAMAASA